MQALNLNNISVDKLALFSTAEHAVTVSLLRLDKVHPVISGNKWFKLKYHFEDAIAGKKKLILTFGGAWSNHLVATAAACQLYKIPSIGLVRGEEPAGLSDTLKMALECGMKLVFLSRQDYQQKKIPPEFLSMPDEIYTIPEGGYGARGAAGAATMTGYCQLDKYTHLACAVGTGTMMAGLIKSALPGQSVLGISVLKNHPGLLQDADSLLTVAEKAKPHRISDEYHFGGYAKYKKELLDFMNDTYRRTGIPTDFVYTGKLLFGIADLIRKNYFPPGSRLLLIHSGGLQGNKSLAADELIF